MENLFALEGVICKYLPDACFDILAEDHTIDKSKVTRRHADEDPYLFIQDSISCMPTGSTMIILNISHLLHMDHLS